MNKDRIIFNVLMVLGIGLGLLLTNAVICAGCFTAIAVLGGNNE